MLAFNNGYGLLHPKQTPLEREMAVHEFDMFIGQRVAAQYDRLGRPDLLTAIDDAIDRAARELMWRSTLSRIFYVCSRALSFFVH